MGRPEPARLDLFLEGADKAGEAGEVGVDHLQRPNLFLDELLHPIQLLLELGLGRKIPAHRLSLLVVRRGRRRIKGVARMPKPISSPTAATFMESGARVAVLVVGRLPPATTKPCLPSRFCEISTLQVCCVGTT